MLVLHLRTELHGLLSGSVRHSRRRPFQAACDLIALAFAGRTTNTHQTGNEHTLGLQPSAT